MARKCSKGTLRTQLKPASRWGGHLLWGVLLVAVLGASGVAAQLLAAPPSWESTMAAPASPAADGQRLSSAAGEASSVQTLYVYGDQLRPLVEETGGVQTLNIYGPGGQIIAQVVQDGQGGQEVRYLLTDHLGSTRAVLDADGNAVARFEYGPHGETTAAGTAAAEARYTGHPYDDAQGVYETPGRGYDPTTGRFLSVDPQRADASPYVYAGNNPVGYIDPTGDIRYPFFIVADYMASTHLTQMEGILNNFGRPRQGTSAGMTTFSDLASVETRGDDLAALPNASRLVTGGAADIDSSRTFIFTSKSSTLDEIRNIAEGMARLRYLSRMAGEPAGSLFKDVTIIASHESTNVGELLFESLEVRGFPRVRMFVQTFTVTRPTLAQPNSRVLSVTMNRLLVLPDGSERWATIRDMIPPQDYREMMGLDPPPLPGGGSNGHAPGEYRPFVPQLEIPRPAPRPQPQIQAQVEPVVPPVNEPLIPNIPEEFGVE